MFGAGSPKLRFVASTANAPDFTIWATFFVTSVEPPSGSAPWQVGMLLAGAFLVAMAASARATRATVRRRR